MLTDVWCNQKRLGGNDISDNISLFLYRARIIKKTNPVLKVAVDHSFFNLLFNVWKQKWQNRCKHFLFLLH